MENLVDFYANGGKLTLEKTVKYLSGLEGKLVSNLVNTVKPLLEERDLAAGRPAEPFILTYLRAGLYLNGLYLVSNREDLELGSVVDDSIDLAFQMIITTPFKNVEGSGLLKGVLALTNLKAPPVLAKPSTKFNVNLQHWLDKMDQLGELQLNHDMQSRLYHLMKSNDINKSITLMLGEFRPHISIVQVNQLIMLAGLSYTTARLV